jgi:hypothetical protein
LPTTSLRILIAEDNIVNQKVALPGKTGLSADIVNGAGSDSDRANTISDGCLNRNGWIDATHNPLRVSGDKEPAVVAMIQRLRRGGNDHESAGCLSEQTSAH